MVFLQTTTGITKKKREIMSSSAYTLQLEVPSLAISAKHCEMVRLGVF